MAKLKPFAWQVEDVETLKRSGFTGLLAIEAGGTKTFITTLAIAEAKPSVTLIFAPKSTHKTAWIPTIRDNMGVEARIIGNDNKATKLALFDFELGTPGIYLCTHQFATRYDISNWRGDMLVVDEIHSAGATPKSKLQRKLSGYAPSDGEPLAARFWMRLALSGTPMRQDFFNMWGIMRFLWGQTHYLRGQVAYDNAAGWQVERMDYEEIVTGVTWRETDWTSYRNRGAQTWGKVIEGVPHLGEPKKARKFLTEKEPGRLLAEMPCVIVHKRREWCCRHHAPVQRPDGTWTQGGFLTTQEPQIINRTVPLTPAQRKAVNDMENIMMTYLGENPLVADIPLTQKQRVRQLTLGEAIAEEFIAERDGEEVLKTTLRYEMDCKSPFLDEAIHILSNLPRDESVVLHVSSQQFAEVAVNRLTQAGFPAQEYSGVRKADLTKFGTDYRVLVGVTAAIGTGTDGLQGVSQTEIWIEQPVSLTMKEQGHARLDRMGGRQVQRFNILDDMGVQEGRMEDLLVKKEMVRRSLTRA